MYITIYFRHLLVKATKIISLNRVPCKVPRPSLLPLQNGNIIKPSSYTTHCL